MHNGVFSSDMGALVAVLVTMGLASKRRDVRKSLLLSIAVGLVFWIGGIAATSVHDQRSMQVPDVTLTAIDGTRVNLRSSVGKPIVISIWATWCTACSREMSVLRDAQSKYTDVLFMFVNQGQSLEAIRNYLKNEQLILSNVLLDRRLELDYQTESRALPTTLFFNRSGTLVERRSGALSAAKLASHIEQISNSY